MSTDYVVPPIVNDPDALAQDAYSFIAAAIPGWVASPGNLDSLIIEAFAQVAAVQGDIASTVATAVFRYLGGLVGVNPLDAVAATAIATVSVQDTAGYTVPAGSTVGIRDANGVLQGLDLVGDLVIPSGSSSGAGEFVIAETPGADANGLSGVAQLVSTPGFVTSVVLTTATSGGIDAEDDATYLNRLTQTLALLTPRPILPNDFSVLARGVAGVGRAATVDLLKPGPPYSGTAEATGQALTVTTAVATSAGLPVPTATRTAVQTLLSAEREQGFAVYAVDPQYTPIDVTATVQAWHGYDIGDVQTRVAAALAALLNPATWGTDVGGDAATWVNDPTVRQGELIATIMAVDGVRYITAGPTFRTGAGAFATTDVTLGAGSAIPALPTAGTMSITALVG